MYRIVDSIISISILIIILLVGNRIGYVFGGSLSLVILLPALYYISYVQKHIQLAASLFGIILVALLGINYLNYCCLLEIYPKTTITIFYCLLIALTQLCLYFILVTQLKRSLSDDQCINAKVNFKFIVLDNSLLSLLYIMMICIVFDTFQDYSSISNHIIKVIPTSFVFIPVFFLILNRTLTKKIQTRHLKYILRETKFKFPENNDLKKTYFFLMGMIFFLGCGIELTRNEWILWVETYLIVSIVPIIFWNVYKYRHLEKQSLPLDQTLKVESLINPKLIFKNIIINTIVIAVVTFSMIALFLFLG